MIEEWANIPGFDDKYQISNLGRIRSKRRILKTKKTIHGYDQINLYVGMHVFKTVFIHIEVAKQFLHGYDSSLTVNHKDGNKSNNAVSNLEYMTQLENNKHKYTILEGKSRWGVYRYNNRWRAMIRIPPNSKKILLGNFDDIEDAYTAYSKEYFRQHGVCPW